MSTAIIASYAFITKQINIYGNILVFITGIVGGILNIIIFLSLHTFRRNSCAFYLTIMSIVNIGNLLFGIIPRFMTAVYNSDGTENSLFYCKCKTYFTTICATSSMTCFCLATIDQYCATCSRPRFQQWCNIKLARRLVILFIVFWILHATPYLFLFQHTISPTTGNTVCTMTNTIYIQYRAYVIVFTFTGILPVSVSIIFGSLAYHNLKQLAHYTVPLVRRELDKQLTIMVLTQVVIASTVIIPFITMYVIQVNIPSTSDPLTKAQIQFVYTITNTILQIYYCSPFYIYVCASERFRRQLIYVLFKIHLNRCQPQLRLPKNQIIPEA